MTESLTVSVVIPCYNGAAFLHETLEAAARREDMNAVRAEIDAEFSGSGGMHENDLCETMKWGSAGMPGAET